MSSRSVGARQRTRPPRSVGGASARSPLAVGAIYLLFVATAAGSRQQSTSETATDTGRRIEQVWEEQKKGGSTYM